MNKKLILGVVATTLVLGAAALVPISAAAQEAATGSTFIQKLAAKLGIQETTLESAFTDVRSEMEAERIAKLKTEVNTLVTSGKLTQRQADLLIATAEIRPEIRSEMTPPNKEDLSSLTEEERKAKMDEMRDTMEQNLIDALNEKGLNTSKEELSETREAAKSAGLNTFLPGGPKIIRHMF